MRIDSLQLFQFRNYKDIQIQFNPKRLLFFMALMGLVRRISSNLSMLMSIGKNHRTNDTSDMLMFNAEETGIVVKIREKRIHLKGKY